MLAAGLREEVSSSEDNADLREAFNVSWAHNLEAWKEKWTLASESLPLPSLSVSIANHACSRRRPDSNHFPIRQDDSLVHQSPIPWSRRAGTREGSLERSRNPRSRGD